MKATTLRTGGFYMLFINLGNVVVFFWKQRNSLFENDVTGGKL